MSDKVENFFPFLKGLRWEEKNDGTQDSFRVAGDSWTGDARMSFAWTKSQLSITRCLPKVKDQMRFSQNKSMKQDRKAPSREKNSKAVRRNLTWLEAFKMAVTIAQMLIQILWRLTVRIWSQGRRRERLGRIILMVKRLQDSSTPQELQSDVCNL